MSISIPGPAGSLEAIVTQADEPRGAAVLCHPHPQYGGNMHDAVLAVADQVLQDLGYTTVKFNFRGTGASDGAFDNGAGEADDVAAVWEWMQKEIKPAQAVLVGYSFGAAMAWKARANTSPATLVMIAPPVGMMSFGEQASSIGVDIFYGTRDDFIDADALKRLTAGSDQIVAHEIAGSDHFFMGAADELSRLIKQALTQRLT
jgi:alpha/beta superfamily hydrolase